MDLLPQTPTTTARFLYVHNKDWYLSVFENFVAFKMFFVVICRGGEGVERCILIVLLGAVLLVSACQAAPAEVVSKEQSNIYPAQAVEETQPEDGGLTQPLEDDLQFVEVEELPTSTEQALTETVFSAEEVGYFIRQAEFLADHLITLSYFRGEFCRNTFVLIAGASLELGQGRLADSISIGNPEYTLFDSFGFVREPSSQWEEYEFFCPVESVNRIVYEVFGEESWVLIGPDVLLDEEQKVFQTSLGFCINTFNHGWRGMTAKLLENPTRVAVSFDLLYPTSIDGDPGLAYGGRHTITFQLMRDEQRAFLRLLDMEQR